MKNIRWAVLCAWLGGVAWGQGPNIIPVALPAAYATAPYSQTLTVVNTANCNWSVPPPSVLPPELTLVKNAVPSDGTQATLSGTPTTAGSYTFTVRAACGPFTPTLTDRVYANFVVNPPPAIITLSVPAGAVGVNYSFFFSAINGILPYAWTMTGAVPGLKLSANGELAGVPGAIGTYPVRVTVRDSNGAVDTASYNIRIFNPVTITTNSLPPAIAGSNYSTVLAASGGVPPYKWASSGLPSGMTLGSTSGLLSGILPLAGSVSIPVQVTDSVGLIDVRNYNLSVAPSGAGLGFSANSLSFFGFVGGDFPSPQPLIVISTSGSPVPFSAQAAGLTDTDPVPRWLIVRAAKATTPARIIVAVDTTGMEAGSYAARILLDSPVAKGVVQVALKLDPEPQHLSVFPDVLRFAGTARSLSPGEQPLIVRNSGGGGPFRFRAFVRGPAPWLSVTPDSGQTGPNAPALLRVRVNVSGLDPGADYFAVIVIEAVGPDPATASIPVALLVRKDGPVIGLSANGLRFDVRAGHGAAAPRAVNIFNDGGGTLNWRADILSGFDWLSTTPSAGTAPSQPQFTGSPGGHAPGGYYALVRISSANAVNSPQYLVAVLNVAAGDTTEPVPEVLPQGLFFVTPGAQPQSVQVYTSSSGSIPFQVSPLAGSGANWLLTSVNEGFASSGSPGQVSVSINTTGLQPGIYTGEVTFTFSSLQVRSVNVTLIVLPLGASPPVGAVETKISGKAAAGCTASKLALTATGLASNFAAPAGWPTPIAVRVNDDCGEPVRNAQVIASFSNGDPALPLRLSSSTAPVYSATWTPGRSVSNLALTVRATAASLAQASTELGGAVTPNKVPVLTPNATVNNFNPVVGALAPGTVVQIYGAELTPAPADSPAPPLPTQLNGTQVVVSGIEAPLYYVRSGQVGAHLPLELEPGREHSIVVAANGGYTQPDTLFLAPARPGVLQLGGRLFEGRLVDGSLVAQRLDGSLVSPDAPARPGEYLTLYLVGMGGTNPPVPAGKPTPADPFSPVTSTATVRIGGREVPVGFAGLTPFFAGLYQINIQLPSDMPPGEAEVVVSQGDGTANITRLPIQP